MAVTRREITAFAALAALPAALPATAPAAAVSANQCMTRVLSSDEMRRGVESQITCYRTQTEMLAAAGLGTVGGGRDDGTRSTLDNQLLAIHYTDANGGGSSLSVFGTSCDGGGINLSGPFNDSISSTLHQLCGRIKHFADANGGGDNQITFGGLANLNASMNDRTSSSYYYAS